MAGRRAWLRCVECGEEEPLGPRFEGCDPSADAVRRWVLEFDAG